MFSVIRLVSGVRYHPPCHVHCQPTFRTLSPPSWTPQGFQFWGKIDFLAYTGIPYLVFWGREGGLVVVFKTVLQKVLATAGCACCFGLLGLVQSTWGFLGFSYALRFIFLSVEGKRKFLHFMFHILIT